MHLYVPPKPADSIPVVDLTDARSAALPRRRAADAIHRACRDTGFFYVANHGIPRGLIEKQFEFARAFFDLPEPQKMQLWMKKNRASVGYEPVGGQKLDSQEPGKAVAPPDLKESFYWGVDVPDDHPFVRAGYRGYGRNFVPPIPGFADQMERYATAMRELGSLLLQLLAISLEMPDDWFRPSFASNGGRLRMIKYPPQPELAEFNQIGAGAHTDWGAITLLAQDDVGGLEVCNVAGEWVQAPPIPGTLVINLGDLMARWTNGVYNSNLHRVKNNLSDRNRYSIPFFYNADPPAVIDPIPSCVTADSPRKFATCTSEQHTAEMFRRSYGYMPGKAVAS